MYFQMIENESSWFKFYKVPVGISWQMVEITLTCYGTFLRNANYNPTQKNHKA